MLGSFAKQSLKAKLRDQGLQSFVVQCQMEGARGQSANLPPTFVVRGQGKAYSAESIPASVSINRVSCQPYELTNQRCTDPKCKHRPADAAAEVSAEPKVIDPASEINRDDMEERAEDELDVTEAPPDADSMEVPAPEVSEVDLANAKDIHCFARPVIWYERMLKEVGHCESTRKVIVLSRRVFI